MNRFVVALIAASAAQAHADHAMHASLSEKVVYPSDLIGEHMCAKLRDGSLECWGLDAAPPKVVLPPGSLDGPFAGGQDGCTIRKDGRVACWGSNSEGRLGDGSSPYLDSPAAVPGLQ